MARLYKFAGLLLLLLVVSITLFSQKVSLQGCAPEYDGMEIVFYRFTDRISNSTAQLATVKLSTEGCFNTRFVLEETTQVFVDLGAIRGYFYAEKGKTYHLILPPYTPLREADRLNPYFKPDEIHLGVEESSPGELNYLIGTFDIVYNAEYNSAVNKAFEQKSLVEVDSLVLRLDTLYSNYHQPFFDAYRLYRMGFLEQMTMHRKARALSDAYFLNKPVQYANPAYMDLFNKVYDRYFVFYSRASRGKELIDAIGAKHSYALLKKVLRQNEVLSNDTLMEAVVLKSLHDGFYDDKFSRSSLLIILDSLYFNTSIPEHRVIAQNIREKVTKLLPGFVPPKFELFDLAGNKHSLDEYKGKYVYLNFGTSASYSCLQEFKSMVAIKKKYDKYLTIVSIMSDESEAELKSFVEQTGYDWIFLYYKNKPEVITDFDVRAFPSFFVIAPDGRILISPAAAPSEKFELKFFDLLKSRGDL
ncbi:TlpA family protein disulfide reductase [Williamwhitmania taraxaci]|uniref:Peroxiredoxin n=1 Tax=Williamwhitmania taraxaci TaxID=1640674 RepID=A0A1G6LD63_9BACT|nr:TlpA disulfide reductase family protein [Williamwhitmania taraxaci]SDC41151.1 Peroxiredoxin [Williamwhitmania taraxaci]